MTILNELYDSYINSPEYQEICRTQEFSSNDRLTDILAELLKDSDLRIPVSDLAASAQYDSERFGFLIGFHCATQLWRESTAPPRCEMAAPALTVDEVKKSAPPATADRARG